MSDEIEIRMRTYPAADVILTPMIERFGKDATGNQVSEGYYAVAPNTRGVVLVPPNAEMAKGMRLATADEVQVGPEQPACVEHLAGGTVDHEAMELAKDHDGAL